MNVFNKMNLQSLLDYEQQYPDVDLSTHLAREAKKIPINILAITNQDGPNKYVPSLITIGWFNAPILEIDNDQWLSVTPLNVDFFNIINYDILKLGFNIVPRYNHYYAEPTYVEGKNRLSLSEKETQITGVAQVRLGSIVPLEKDNLLFNMLEVANLKDRSIYKNFLIDLNNQKFYNY